MHKVFCDRCHKEIKPSSARHSISIPVHIAEQKNSYAQIGQDGAMDFFSGRSIAYGLCLPCSNVVYQVAWVAIVDGCKKSDKTVQS